MCTLRKSLEKLNDVKLAELQGLLLSGIHLNGEFEGREDDAVDTIEEIFDERADKAEVSHVQS
jgi:hypothetical protein